MKLSTTIYQRCAHIFSLILLLVLFLVLWLSWDQIPDKIPSHYNFAGEIDRYGGKMQIWFLPILGAVLWVSLSLIERFPQIWNTGVTVTKENGFRVYRELKNMLVTMKASLTIIFSIITFESVFSLGINRYLLPLTLALVFGPLIIFIVRLYKAR